MNNFLSNIELYFSPPQNIYGNKILIDGEEFKHITKVMRHTAGHEVFVTDGCGKIFQTKIQKINSTSLELNVEKNFNYENPFNNIFFCIPRLKNPERFEFILEKCTELGITNFIVYEAERAISKGNKIERWNKILLSAMKQSLRSYLPAILLEKSLRDIKNKPGLKFVFEQNSDQKFDGLKVKTEQNIYFIFGPEGGLSEGELSLFDEASKYKIAVNRLRTETTIIKCASLL
ncbi:MAG: 16S rRNA (uracil(1498)-N(3))-methyltransferase [Ignavibacteriaceae bacterium]